MYLTCLWIIGSVRAKFEMSGSLMICQISDDLKSSLKKFRFQKSTSTSALILKVIKDTQELLVDEELEDVDVDEIRNSLPSQQPRFVLISYKLEHTDGRVSYPLCMVFYSPAGCNPEVQMLYAGSKNNLAKECGLTKNFEIRDLEELDEDYLIERLGGK